MSLLFIAGEAFLISLFLLLLYFYNSKQIRSIEIAIIITILAISILHIFEFNTDAEDTYIGLRYVKNLVEGNGFVFNTFDRVEGYSDFLWLLLIAGLNKLTGIDIPIAARCLGLFFSIITFIYTYFLSYKLSGDKRLAFFTIFLLAVNGSYSCYGLSGLENSLFALFILLSVDSLLDHRWFRLGIIISLATMTRPEGVVLSIPVVLYLFYYGETWKYRILNLLKVGLSAGILFIPWTYWRYDYYGYLIPNTIAAKDGMDIMYQLKIGIKYSLRFLFHHIEWTLLAIPSFMVLIKSGKLRNTFHLIPRSIFVCGAGTLTFALVYTYFGGDWMPGFRFYSSIIPLLSVLTWLIWQKSQMKISFAAWSLILALLGISQIRNSVHSPYMIKAVRGWDHEVEGLKMIGKWFHNTLPSTTLLATFPNGAFSYYNNLPTLDAGGLTDTQVGRFGNKRKVGGHPGHIAENWNYIFSKKPEIIAIMNGQGFESKPSKVVWEGYSCATFVFPDYANPLGNFVNLYIRTDKETELIEYLLKEERVKLVP